MALFAFMQPPDQEFIFELTDEAMIAKARKIISGEEKEEIHVGGRIKKRLRPYNLRWSYHLDPKTIHFFAVATEECDADMAYVEDHLDEVCGALLPLCLWFPRNSRVIREVAA